MQQKEYIIKKRTNAGEPAKFYVTKLIDKDSNAVIIKKLVLSNTPSILPPTEQVLLKKFNGKFLYYEFLVITQETLSLISNL